MGNQAFHDEFVSPSEKLNQLIDGVRISNVAYGLGVNSTSLSKLDVISSGLSGNYRALPMSTHLNYYWRCEDPSLVDGNQEVVFHLRRLY